MAIFEEKQPRSVWCIILILAAFLLSYPVWHIAERELFWSEGEYACAANEIHTFPPNPTAHGQDLPDVYPLFPLLAKAVSVIFGASMEFSLRFISVLSLLILTLVVGIAAYRTAGKQAGIASSVILCTTLLMAEKAMVGYPDILTVLLLYAAWLLWFAFGMNRSRWNMAWICAGVFVGLAYYSGGPKIFPIFLIPMILLRRPLSIWSKLKKPGFFAGMLILLFFLALIWVGNLYNELKPVENGTFSPSFSAFLWYLKKLILYPFGLVLRFLPWSLMLWAPFCPALDPLDRHPLFNKYLQTIFISLCIVFWLLPVTKSRDLLYLLPAFSLMIGLNYWIVVRRYGDKFLKLFAVLGITGGVVAVAGIVLSLIPGSWSRFIQPALDYLQINCKGIPTLFQPGRHVMQIVELSIAIIAGCSTIILSRKRSPVWMTYLAVFSCFMILFGTMISSSRAQDHSNCRFAGAITAAILDSGSAEQQNTLYKDSMISGLCSELYYTGFNIRTINFSTEQKSLPDPVYVISPDVPSSWQHSWTKLGLFPYQDKNIYLYKGILRKD